LLCHCSPTALAAGTNATTVATPSPFTEELSSTSSPSSTASSPSSAVTSSTVASTATEASTNRCDGLTDVKQTCPDTMSDNGCKVLADNMRGRTCRQYCSEHKLACVGAWEEESDDCNVKKTLTCDETYGTTSDLLCECSPQDGAADVDSTVGAASASGRLVWSEEFDGSSVNTSKWDIVNKGGGFGNNEKQFYRSENAIVQDGVLKIEAKCESYGGDSFTSAKLRTKGKADWGPGHRVDVRARLPQGKGTWPAIWMLPTEKAYGGWPDSGEIDIVEAVGCTKNKVYGTVHTERYNHMKNTEKGGSTRTDVSMWHTYSIEWTDSKITWYLDGKEYHKFAPSSLSSSRWPFDKEFYLILNLAVGGSWGGKCVGGTPSCSKSSEFGDPQVMEVDFARVYAL